jgi:hypothetical protein
VWIDARTDVYALGVILFEMLTGRVPFGGDTCAEILQKQIVMTPPVARSLRPELAEALEAILQRALAKRPADRFPSMAAMTGALLDPAAHVGTVPAQSVHDDLSGRFRAARPMTRAEIMRRRSAASGIRSTLREQVGELVREVDPFEVDLEVTKDLVPARNRSSAWLAIAMTAAASAAIAFGVTRAKLTPDIEAPIPMAVAGHAPTTVRLTFASDPYGAELVGPDGQTLGETPLSIEVPASDTPAEYTFRLSGYAEKKMTLIPNLASPVFATLHRQVATDEPAAASPTVRRSHHGASSGSRAHRARWTGLDDDNVLAPSY